MDYLNRNQAPIPGQLWSQIDQAAVAAAKDLLTGRRFLDLEGPYGLGLTSVEIGTDDYCRQPAENEAGAVVSRALSMPMIRKSFKLSMRRLAAHADMCQPIDLAPVQDAAEAVARREEEFIYYGQGDFGLDGLFTAKGRSTVQRGDWRKVEQALDDVLGAVDALDGHGFHGPYALALSPALYNFLFRRYEGTDMLQLEHIRRLCELGVYKAEVENAVLVDGHVGRLVLGQDLSTGYSSHDGIHLQLFATESIVLLIEEPQAICTLETPTT